VPYYPHLIQTNASSYQQLAHQKHLNATQTIEAKSSVMDVQWARMFGIIIKPNALVRDL